MTTEKALVRVYDHLAEAQDARAALLASGFPLARVHLSAREDDGGPVEGNFTVGNGRQAADADPYDVNYLPVVQRGAQVLQVEIESADERERARRILTRFGGIDVEARASQAGAAEGATRLRR